MPSPPSPLGALVTRDAATLRSAPGRWFGRPSLTARPDGTWVLVYRDAPEHGPSTDSSFHVAFSTDEGETWTDDDTTPEGEAVEGFPHTRPDADVSDATVKHHRGDLLFHVSEERDAGGWRGTRQLRSTDGGRTWTDEGILDPAGIEPESVLLGQDDAVHPDTGAIYEGVNYRTPGDGPVASKSGLLRSTDGGHSWEYAADVTEFGDGTGELGITFVDGDLLACCRAFDDTGTYVRRSPDGGETWGELRSVEELGLFQKARLYTPGDIGSDAHDNQWVYAVGRHVIDFDLDLDRGDERRHVRGSQHTAITASPDAGETWYEPVHLDEFAWPAPFGDCGYCDLRIREDGSLYVVTYGGHSYDGPADLYAHVLEERP